MRARAFVAMSHYTLAVYIQTNAFDSHLLFLTLKRKSQIFLLYIHTELVYRQEHLILIRCF